MFCNGNGIVISFGCTVVQVKSTFTDYEDCMVYGLTVSGYFLVNLSKNFRIFPDG